MYRGQRAKSYLFGLAVLPVLSVLLPLDRLCHPEVLKYHARPEVLEDPVTVINKITYRGDRVSSIIRCLLKWINVTSDALFTNKEVQKIKSHCFYKTDNLITNKWYVLSYSLTPLLCFIRLQLPKFFIMKYEAKKNYLSSLQHQD